MLVRQLYLSLKAGARRKPLGASGSLDFVSIRGMRRQTKRATDFTDRTDNKISEIRVIRGLPGLRVADGCNCVQRHDVCASSTLRIWPRLSVYN